jgi:hypothetical protein
MPPDFGWRRALLLQAGVREPKASQLARLPHATPDFVRAHLEATRAQGHPLGTAIHRIQNDWPVEQPTRKSGHAEDCNCNWCVLDRRVEEARRRSEAYVPEEKP